MGRRKKSSKKAVKKKKPTVATVFKCPFCSHDGSVECDLNWKTRIGELNCRICGANFQTMINNLTDPIDVFCEWIDACEEQNR